ncbi:hypothetical protein L1987_16276 [Smallanthus sonchifolius]|uniref:Uncharacterized protein n=1 Tax=Smallanthus sonchifolius TaxID=185202 RepID=A0ACB9J8R4_9ASTR|nr:hypothetical protein L1987_16276 [Smallanthus sonchifolius]
MRRTKQSLGADEGMRRNKQSLTHLKKMATIFQRIEANTSLSSFRSPSSVTVNESPSDLVLQDRKQKKISEKGLNCIIRFRP